MFSGDLAAPDRRSRHIDRASWRAEHAMLGRGLPEHRIASVKSAPGRRLLRVVSIVRTRKFADPNIGSNPQISADPPTWHRCIWEFPAPERDDAWPPHERPQPLKPPIGHRAGSSTFVTLKALLACIATRGSRDDYALSLWTARCLLASCLPNYLLSEGENADVERVRTRQRACE